MLSKPRWQRLIIAFAGPFMNVVLAVGVLTGLYMVKYQRVSDADMEPVIGHVAADSPAAKAGIQDGDHIVKLDGKANPTWEDVILKEAEGAYRPMHLTIERNGKRFDTTVTPVLNERIGRGIRRLGRTRRDPIGGSGAGAARRTRRGSKRATSSCR